MTHPLPLSRDPVCGMDVETARSSHSMLHRGVIFRFCSAQCLRRFQENPALYTGTQHIMDMPAMLKQRRLYIGMFDPSVLERACQSIREMKGVASVVSERDVLLVEYDLRQATLEQIEAVAVTGGLSFRGGFHSFRRGMWKFEEHNELDNAAHPATGACCNRPPAGTR